MERLDFRVLIVDDEEGIRDALRTIVSLEGYTAFIAASFAEAKALIAQRTYDLAFVDICLPEDSGIRLLEPLKRAGTKTITITAFATVDTAVEALKSGAADYLRKPFEMDEVRKQCAEAFQSASAERREAASGNPRN